MVVPQFNLGRGDECSLFQRGVAFLSGDYESAVQRVPGAWVVAVCQPQDLPVESMEPSCFKRIIGNKFQRSCDQPASSSPMLTKLRVLIYKGNRRDSGGVTH